MSSSTCTNTSQPKQPKTKEPKTLKEQQGEEENREPSVSIRGYSTPQAEEEIRKPSASIGDFSMPQGEGENRKPSVSNRGFSMPLLLTTYACFFTGSVSSTLISKFYFIHGGSSQWFATWIQSAGFPLLFLPIYLFKTSDHKPFSRFTPQTLISSLLIGLMMGLNNLLFSFGNSYLPVSTSSLLLSTQLIFTLLFSFFIVKQKITFLNLNCVVLLTLSSVLLALGSNRDKPPGLNRSNYFIGFFSTVGAGLLFALYLPVMEKLYRKVHCFSMVMEMQLVMEMVATVLATVGMMTSDSGFFEAWRTPTAGFDLGPRVYWLVLVGANAVTWQLCFAATAGMVYLTSGITGGICMTALLAVNVLSGVAVYGEAFGGVKVVSTFLCVWGFCSYVYGKYVKMVKEEEEEEEERYILATVAAAVDEKV